MGRIDSAYWIDASMRMQAATGTSLALGQVLIVNVLGRLNGLLLQRQVTYA